ncbi:uncharacterized protein [Clytia hemisphaerica]|uniref:Uncharacterized protein n=1 Tax=Clytia hemisphaerica TaxID=252671 RepID=A0A7M6DMS2_9CNID
MRNIFKPQKVAGKEETKSDFYKRCSHTYTSKYPFLTKVQIKAKVNIAWKKLQKKRKSLEEIDVGKNDNLDVSSESSASQCSRDAVVPSPEILNDEDLDKLECSSNSTSVKEVMDIPDTPESGLSPSGKENISPVILEGGKIQDVVDSCTTEDVVSEDIEMIEISNPLTKAPHQNFMKEIELIENAESDIGDDIEFKVTCKTQTEQQSKSLNEDKKSVECSQHEDSGLGEKHIDSKLDDCLDVENRIDLEESSSKNVSALVESDRESNIVDLGEDEKSLHNIQCSTDNNFKLDLRTVEKQNDIEVTEILDSPPENQKVDNDDDFANEELSGNKPGQVTHKNSENTQESVHLNNEKNDEEFTLKNNESCVGTGLNNGKSEEISDASDVKQLKNEDSKNELSSNERDNSNEPIDGDVKKQPIRKNENNILEREQQIESKLTNGDVKLSSLDKTQNQCLINRNQFFSDILNQTEDLDDRNQALTVDVAKDECRNQPFDEGDSGFLTDLFSKRDGNRPPVKTNDATGRSLLMVSNNNNGRKIEEFDMLGNEDDIFA